MLRTRRVENLRHGALTTTAGTREGSTITATASPHPFTFTLNCHLGKTHSHFDIGSMLIHLRCTHFFIQ